MENKKASLIYILKVLEEYTDSNHYLTQNQIREKVYEKYGLLLERKSIGASLSLLSELDFDIVRGNKGGFALFSRVFDDSEVKYLIDAIFSSKSLSGKQAKSLCNKISNTLSKYERNNYTYLLKTSEINRTTNKEVFYNIELINEAIKRGKWVGFKYQSYDENGKPAPRFDGYVYHMSPCYLVNNFGRYYLLAYGNKHKTVITWRVDNMTEVYIMEERDRIDPHTLDEFKKYDSFTEYLNDHIYLFGGATINAVVEVDEPKSLTYITDWFGQNVYIYKENDKLRAQIKCNETAFFYWVMQYSEHIKIISPESMVNKIKSAAKTILDKYA